MAKQLERLGNHGTHSVQQYVEWSNGALKRLLKLGDDAAASFKQLNSTVGEYSACIVNERAAIAHLMDDLRKDIARLVVDLSCEKRKNSLQGASQMILGKCQHAGCVEDASFHLCQPCLMKFWDGAEALVVHKKSNKA